MANINKIKAQGSIYDIEDTVARTSAVVVTSKPDGTVELQTPTSTVTVPSLTNFGDPSELENDVVTEISDLKSEIDQIGGGGQPVPVTLASEMTDTEQIYVYLGEETGYDYGYIYVYLNDAWTKTGLYGRGANGTDGYSPTATVTSTSTGASISVTDKNGTTTATLTNGTATQEQVNAWLNNHPEATTTVEDGAVTTAKLADGAVTQAKLDPNLELGVADNSVTTPKIVDHAVTFEKTDFYYKRSLKDTYDWVYGIQATSNRSAIIGFKWSMMEQILDEFPETLNIVVDVTSDLWSSGSGNPTIACTGHSYTLTRSNKTITVDGSKYAVITFTRENFLAGYNELNQYIESEGASWLDREFYLNNTKAARIPVDADFYFADCEITNDLVRAGFTTDVMSQDFATAVQRALESEGTSTDEETAKNALTGKVMVCLGDSYTAGMASLLSAVATKYGMAIDNRGRVSSSICGTSVNVGTKGDNPMWERADGIVTDYTNGYTIGGTSYTANDVGVIMFMGGANDGFGINTWVGTGIHETSKETIYGACNHIFNVLAKNFTKAKLICITQPSHYVRTVASVPDDATAQIYGFENLAELQQMDDIQFSNYSMAVKEEAVYKTAYTYGWNIIDMFHDMPTMFNPSNRSAYWNSDKLHLTNAGYSLISQALDKKIVELVVG